MNDNESTTTTKNESTGVALAGMIFSIISLICAFMPNWRTIGMVIGIIGIVVSAFALFKTNQLGAKKSRAIAGIVIGVLAVIVSVFFLYFKNKDVKTEENEIPVELKDTSAQETDNNNALEKLQGLTDSSNAE